ncbi:MAG: phosphoribosylamine--glycine ligase [Burkholderiaceae bacterium]|jgi:phosphoribosylamine--glycine ligase|nr:phosphoribosylamine--glycine ligase [Burkholderiaceae bacterium]
MKILVIGAGGREHALAWKFAQSRRIQVVYVAPGNGGTASDSRMENIDITDPESLAEFALKENIGITVVGPEAPLSNGIVDDFRAKGLKIFGPTKKAAQLEASKSFAKSFMVRHGIPTAAHETFTDATRAHQYITKKGGPLVVKADGLAAGKGVVVAMTTDEAHTAVDTMLTHNRFGNAGNRVVIEEYLEGEEVSFIVMVDGKNVLPLATSQDHKRLNDNDQGPNTGGMGAYSPARIVTPTLHSRILREIINPAVAGMAKDGIPYTGFLYAGLMIGADGKPRTLEFNCRMGDPETQPILARLRNDFVDVMEHAVGGTLDKVELQWDHRIALGVVLASEGYPDAPTTGHVISGIPKEGEDCVVFHAGTALAQKQFTTTGGRVLCVVGLSDTMRMAQKIAYEAIREIRFDGMQYRRDIGWRAARKPHQ